MQDRKLLRGVVSRFARLPQRWTVGFGALLGTAALLSVPLLFQQPTAQQTASATSLDADLELEDIEQPSGQACEPNLQPAVQKTDPVNRYWLPLVDWATNPQMKFGKAIGALGPQLLATAAPAAWPDIHERAQMARVPLIMYHDILAEKQVFFDITPEELEADFQLIRDNGLTPISLDRLVAHLRTGLPLPEKPILLTFDDGYVGHYEHVYPLLKQYGYPAVFSVFTDKLDGNIVGRSTLTWEQVQEMAADPLVTIASHSITHPRNLTEVESDEELAQELSESKQLLEARLGIPIHYFTYPEGHYDERVMEAAEAAGYRAALTMDDFDERFAGESENVLAIARFGQSQLESVIEQAWGGPPYPRWGNHFDFSSPVQLERTDMEGTPLMLISGGKPITIHADSRYQVSEIIEGTGAIAAVDGGFFSLKYLDSNVMIGPVLSRYTQEFVPGNASENPKLRDRPLVLMSENGVQFIPFDPDLHNTLEGIQAEMPDVTDAFVGAAFLVRDGQPQPPEAFGDLFDFDAARHRAFWGINHAGQPTVGATGAQVGSVNLGKYLAQVGFRDAVMLDSGASTSLAYEGESLMHYTPRPVPHVVALLPPGGTMNNCSVTARRPLAE